MPVSLVRDLGIYIDLDVTMTSHVSKTKSGSFSVLSNAVYLPVNCPSVTSVMSGALVAGLL